MKRTAILLACAALLAPPDASACTVVYDFHATDPSEEAVDMAPPAAPAAELVEVRRGRGSGCSASSCDDLGSLVLHVSSVDDRTLPAQIGYVITLADGTLPDGFSLPVDPIRADPDGVLVLVWIDGSSDDQETLSFSLALAPVDLGGNVGPATILEIDHEGTGGCAIGRGGGWSGAMLFVACIVWLRKQRRASFRRLP